MPEIIRLVGADRFEKDLIDAVHELNDFSQATTSTARTIMSTAQSTVPRLTGKLASSMISSADSMAAKVKSSLVYAPVIHYGWRGHGIESQPWLVNAAHSTESNWVRAFETRVDNILEKMDKNYS